MSDKVRWDPQPAAQPERTPDGNPITRRILVRMPPLNPGLAPGVTYEVVDNGFRIYGRRTLSESDWVLFAEQKRCDSPGLAHAIVEALFGNEASVSQTGPEPPPARVNVATSIPVARMDQEQRLLATLAGDEGWKWLTDMVADIHRVVVVDDSVDHCRICGCTEERACPEGCHWVEPDLCSNPLCIRAAAASQKSPWLEPSGPPPAMLEVRDANHRVIGWAVMQGDKHIATIPLGTTIYDESGLPIGTGSPLKERT